MSSYVWKRGYNGLDLEKLLDLYESGAAHVQSMVANFPPGSLGREVVANGVIITVEEVILYLMAHDKLHLWVIRKRYLS